MAFWSGMSMPDFVVEFIASIIELLSEPWINKWTSKMNKKWKKWKNRRR